MNLLLLSNSKNHDAGYLDHAEGQVRALFAGVTRIAFVPFALKDMAGYTAIARERFGRMGIAVEGIAPDGSARGAIEKAAGIFVGGGNTFRLLDCLLRLELLPVIRSRVLDGMPYLGSSAGTVIAAPTLQTTNDMPIVWPSTPAALGFIRFQINCHYLDSDPASTHMGETRETRLREYLEENDTPVLGIREGTKLTVKGAPGDLRIDLIGAPGARLFQRGAEPREVSPGSDLGALARLK